MFSLHLLVHIGEFAQYHFVVDIANIQLELFFHVTLRVQVDACMPIEFFAYVNAWRMYD